MKLLRFKALSVGSFIVIAALLVMGSLTMNVSLHKVYADTLPSSNQAPGCAQQSSPTLKIPTGSPTTNSPNNSNLSIPSSSATSTPSNNESTDSGLNNSNGQCSSTNTLTSSSSSSQSANSGASNNTSQPQTSTNKGLSDAPSGSSDPSSANSATANAVSPNNAQDTPSTNNTTSSNATNSPDSPGNNQAQQTTSSVTSCPTPASSTTSSSDSSSTSSAGSNNVTSPTSNSSGANTNTATINNCSQSSASSGQATSINSGSGGTSTTGSASDNLNQVNQITPSLSTNSQPVTYTDNVYGNQNGNILVNPSQIAEQQNSTSSTNQVSNTTSSNNASINNNDNLLATSGNASVTNNGRGGSATSGNAEALANVVNIIDSAIANKQFFEGTINIYGNLYGDILLPQDLVDQLINPATEIAQSSSNNSVKAAINNNINLLATSGNASVSSGGNANKSTSGNATTILNITNYINSNITAGNLFLVIINVAGHWYGYVLGSIPSSNTDLLGGGISNNQFTQSTAAATGVNSSTESINNNINLAAYSGNASVSNLYGHATATSGNALAIADIANFINDNFSLSGWFGILFINVFGNWYGNLSTYNPNPPSTPGSPTDSQQSNGGGQNGSKPSVQLASYTPTQKNDGTNAASSLGNGYWTYAMVTYYQTIYSYSTTPNTVTTYRTVTYPIKTVKDLSVTTANKNDPTKKSGFNYWLALLSLLPLVGLITYERKSRNRKQD